MVERTAVEKNRLIDLLNAQIEQRTAERVSPRLQAFSDAAQALASARSEQERWEAILRRWDVVVDLRQHVRTLSSQRAQLEADIKQAQQALDKRRTEVINALSEEFAATVRAIGIPGVNSAPSIPRNTSQSSTATCSPRTIDWAAAVTINSRRNARSELLI